MSTFELVRGVEGDCLVLDNTRICGPKPWGGGRVIKTFHADGIYEVINKDEHHKLLAENEKLRQLVEDLYFDLLGEMPESMLEDRRSQMRELGIEVD